MGSLLQTGVVIVALLSGLPALAEPMNVVLKLRGQVTMQQLAQNVVDPKSDHYQRPYEPAEIRKLAAPSDVQYNDLISGFKGEGLTVVKESPTHLWITLRGEKAVFESLFGTTLQSVAGHLHKPMSELRLPFHLNLIESVSGLDNTRQSHPHYRVQDVPTNAGGYTQTQIRNAYGFDQIYSAGITGQGQDIAIATYNGFSIPNVQNYYQITGVSPVPSVEQVNFNGTAAFDAGSAGETELDAEFSGMIAPGANIHVFTSATNDDAGELALFTAILDDNRSRVVNYSWGSCEPQVTAQHLSDMQAVFARAVAQGVNIFVATGDSGSDSCGDGTNMADWPAAAPYIVAVGGTSIDLSGGTLNETGWNGSGGGISGTWALPTWQQGLGTPYVKRSYPDVAFNADPNSGEAIYSGQNPQWMVVGGTSMASPQWAGFMLLVNAARAAQNKAPLGYFSPAAYTLTTAQRAQFFNDVISGSNGKYTAGPGWDAVTGWGSMKAAPLLNYLTTL